MGIETSKITTQGNGDLTIQPDGTGQTKILSVSANNPGTTPIACAADGTVKKLNFNELTEKASLDDTDFVMIHDSATGHTKKVLGSELGGAKQPFFPDPLPAEGEWLEKDTILSVASTNTGLSPSQDPAIIFGINGGTLDQTSKSVQTGDTVRIEWDQNIVNNANHGDRLGGKLQSNDGFAQSWFFNVDKLINSSFAFTNLVDQGVSIVVSSDPVIVTGTFNVPLEVQSTGGQNELLSDVKFSVNGGTYSSSVTVNNTDLLSIQGRTGPNFNDTYSANSSIGPNTVPLWTVGTQSPTEGWYNDNILLPVDGSEVSSLYTFRFDDNAFYYAGGQPHGLNRVAWRVYRVSTGGQIYGSVLAHPNQQQNHHWSNGGKLVEGEQYDVMCIFEPVNGHPKSEVINRVLAKDVDHFDYVKHCAPSSEGLGGIRCTDVQRNGVSQQMIIGPRLSNDYPFHEEWYFEGVSEAEKDKNLSSWKICRETRWKDDISSIRNVNNGTWFGYTDWVVATRDEWWSCFTARNKNRPQGSCGNPALNDKCGVHDGWAIYESIGLAIAKWPNQCEFHNDSAPPPDKWALTCNTNDLGKVHAVYGKGGGYATGATCHSGTGGNPNTRNPVGILHPVRFVC